MVPPIFRSGLVPAAFLPKNVQGIHLQPRVFFPAKLKDHFFLDRGRISKTSEKKRSRISAKNGGGF